MNDIQVKWTDKQFLWWTVWEWISVIVVWGFFALIIFYPWNGKQEPSNTSTGGYYPTSSEKSETNTQYTPLQNTNTYTPPTSDYSSGSYSDNYGTSECIYDCSGHEAGYQWGEDNDICDTEYSNGNSESFDEGVRAWAEDNC